MFSDCLADVVAIWWQMEWPLMSCATNVADVIACGIDGIATQGSLVCWQMELQISALI